MTADNDLIDKTLLSHATGEWRKVGMVVALSMSDLRDEILDLDDVYYAQRIKDLEDKDFIESRGDLSQMRFSEIRLASYR